MVVGNRPHRQDHVASHQPQAKLGAKSFHKFMIYCIHLPLSKYCAHSPFHLSQIKLAALLLETSSGLSNFPLK